MRLAVALAVVAGLALLGCGDESQYGDWVFRGPDCPGAYPNCLIAPSREESMALSPDGDLSAYRAWRPAMYVSCWEDRPFVALFTGGLAFFEAGTASVQFAVDRQQHGPYSVATEGGRGISLTAADADEVVAIMAMADEKRRNVKVELRSYGDSDQYSYNVAGFNRNYRRLPCSGQ